MLEGTAAALRGPGSSWPSGLGFGFWVFGGFGVLGLRDLGFWGLGFGFWVFGVLGFWGLGFGA